MFGDPINKANFALLHWFGIEFQPRFTNLQTQLNHLYAAHDLSAYQHCLIQPVGKINCAIITEEKVKLERIIATLALKDTTQSNIIKKLCTHNPTSKMGKALFEFDKLIRSISTLEYLRDPQRQRHSFRSQNRIESYHQLHAAIAQAGGTKELTGRTDLDFAISNECGRLLANIIVYYNSVILSRLLDKYTALGNEKALKFIKRISPIAWQHIHFLGHYNLKNGQKIDIEAIIENLLLQD